LKLLSSRIVVLEGEQAGLIGFGLLALWWTTLPFWGVRADGSERGKLVTGTGVLLVAWLSSFSLLGYLR
jgi:hypothetical protein